MSGNADSDSPSGIVALQIQQAVTNSKLEAVGTSLAELRTELRELKSNFATKTELGELDKKVNDLRNWNKWVVQIVGGLILTAIISLVVLKGGVPH